MNENFRSISYVVDTAHPKVTINTAVAVGLVSYLRKEWKGNTADAVVFFRNHTRPHKAQHNRQINILLFVYYFF